MEKRAEGFRQTYEGLSYIKGFIGKTRDTQQAGSRRSVYGGNLS